MTAAWQLLTRQDGDRWSEALEKAGEFDVHYSLQYLKVVEDGQTPMAAVYERGSQIIFYPFLLREIDSTAAGGRKLYDITSPYGYGGPLCSPGTEQGMFEDFYAKFNSFCRTAGVVTEFVRFHPLLENHKVMSALIWVERNSSVVVVDLTRSEEEIWQGYHRSNRKNINRARREDVAVIINDSPEHLPRFMEIYKKTMDRSNADRFYYFNNAFFNGIHRLLKGSYVYAHAVIDGVIVSTELLLYNKRYIHSFLGGTLDEYFPCRPNNLLKHEVIRWAGQRGIKYFLLGGGKSDGDGIHKFKSTFSQEQKGFFVGKRIHDKKTFQELAGHIPRDRWMDGFFPPYRR